ncbi:MAG: hypothetical protein ACRC41_04385 [Sarcina sp.]
MKKRLFILVPVIIIFFLLILGGIHLKYNSKNGLIIKKLNTYHGLYHGGQLEGLIYISDSKGNISGVDTNISITKESSTGTTIITCPQNKLTNMLVKNNLNYSKVITLHELGLTKQQIEKIEKA